MTIPPHETGTEKPLEPPIVFTEGAPVTVIKPKQTPERQSLIRVVADQLHELMSRIGLTKEAQNTKNSSPANTTGEPEGKTLSRGDNN